MKNFIDTLRLVSQVDSYFIFIVFFSSFILLVFEILSLGSLIPFISFLSNEGSILLALDLMNPYFKFLNEDNIFYYLSFIIFLIFTLRTISAVLLLRLITARISYSTRLLSIEIYSNSVKQNYKDFIKSNSSQFIRDVHQDITFFGDALRSYINLLMDFVVLLGAVLILFYTNPYIMLSLILSFSFFTLCYVLIFSKKIEFYGEQRQLSLVKMLEYIGESYRGFKAFKLAGLEKFYSASYKKITKRYYDAEIARLFYSQLPKYILEYFILIIAAVITLFFVYFNYSIEEIISFIGILLVSSLRVIPSLTRMILSFQTLNFSSTSEKNVKRYFEHREKDINSDNLNDINYVYPSNPKTIEFKNVGFGYDDKKFLELMNFKINKGSITSIEGESGSGKSTILDLIIGLQKPTEGDILIEGKQFKEDYLLTHITGYVIQDTYIFNKSLKENIALGVETEFIDEEKIENILKDLNLTNLAKQKDGLDVMLGEGGSFISGGQRQRIGIARALYKDSRILILDEATSSLDDESEREVLNILKRKKGKVTIIITAHRGQILDIADHKYKISNKTIAPRGEKN